MTQPEQKFQAGRMFGSVWKNKAEGAEGEERETLNLTIQKRYKDKGGEWKNASSWSVRDIPDARLVLDKAYEYMRLKESE